MAQVEPRETNRTNNFTDTEQSVGEPGSSVLHVWSGGKDWEQFTGVALLEYNMLDASSLC